MERRIGQFSAGTKIVFVAVILGVLAALMLTAGEGVAGQAKTAIEGIISDVVGTVESAVTSPVG